MMLPGKLSRQVAVLQARPDVIGCCHDAEVFDSDSGKPYGRFTEVYNGRRGRARRRRGAVARPGLHDAAVDDDGALVRGRRPALRPRVSASPTTGCSTSNCSGAAESSASTTCWPATAATSATPPPRCRTRWRTRSWSWRLADARYPELHRLIRLRRVAADFRRGEPAAGGQVSAVRRSATSPLPPAAEASSARSGVGAAPRQGRGRPTPARRHRPPIEANAHLPHPIPRRRPPPTRSCRRSSMRPHGRVMASGQFILGPEVTAFEEEFAAYCETRHAIGVGSGLDALRLILARLRRRPGRRGDRPVEHVHRDLARGVAGRRHAGAGRAGPRDAQHHGRGRRGGDHAVARRRSCRCTCTASRPIWTRSRRSGATAASR